MIDFAECTVKIHRLTTEAEQCERDKLYDGAIVELEELIANARMAIEYCFARKNS